MAPSQGRYSGR